MWMVAAAVELRVDARRDPVALLERPRRHREIMPTDGRSCFTDGQARRSEEFGHAVGSELSEE